MNSEELPEDVVQLVLDRLDSVPHLEALVLILEGSPRGLTAGEIAARLYIGPDAALAIIGDLQRRGFVAPAGGDARHTINSEQAALVTRLATIYRQNVYRVASLIHSRSSRAVREFAKAFDITRDKKEGGDG